MGQGLVAGLEATGLDRAVAGGREHAGQAPLWAADKVLAFFARRATRENPTARPCEGGT